MIVGKDRTSYLLATGLFCGSSAFICATTHFDSEANARATFSYAGFIFYLSVVLPVGMDHHTLQCPHWGQR